MTTLFIANCTQQKHRFVYRLPEQRALRHEDIPAGQQRQIGSNLDTGAIDYIISQHVNYGLIEDSKIPRHKGFSGLAYKVGSPIPADRLNQLATNNLSALEEQGQHNMENEAASLATTLSQDGKPLPRVEIEMIENTKSGADPKVSVGVEAVREGVEPRHRGRPRKKK